MQTKNLQNKHNNSILKKYIINPSEPPSSYYIVLSLMTSKHTPTILLSSDTLSGYGLDHIFEVAKEVGFDGIDLATWKNYDAWNEVYVAKLTEKHNLPVKVVQVSSKINAKEMEQAFDLCDDLNVKTISINAPSTFNFSSFNFLITNLRHYHKQKIQKNFAIINPEQKSIV
jgi:hypothetical protein